MNFVFISPHFPKTYWNFCDRLKKNGINVLGIGDCPYDATSNELKSSLTEYYYVDNMLDYDKMYSAVAYYASKYGRIDWIESNNEFWLETDARLRTDFNVITGIKDDGIRFFKSKAEMKKKYAKAGVPTARFYTVKNKAGMLKFVEEVGYPVFAKPVAGVGAADTYKIENAKDLENFFATKPDEEYICEEFIDGNIFSYDAIVDSNYNPLFESMTSWPPSISDIVNKDLNLTYYVAKEVDPKLREYGRNVVKAFDAKNRFVHLEFFKLNKPLKGLAKKGEFVGLEVNMRPAGGYTPDMMNYAHSLDVYQIWADMVAYGERRSDAYPHEYFCAYAGRKDGKPYIHTHEEIMEKYGACMVMCERMPEMMVQTMGNQMYTVRLDSEPEVKEFIEFVIGENK